jgi:hypothetical protein
VFGEISCSPVSGGCCAVVVQTALRWEGRIKSALYLALPQRLPLLLLPRLIAAERFPVSICFDYGLYPQDELDSFSFGAAMFFVRCGLLLTACDRALLRSGSGWREGTRTARSAVLSCPPKR